MLAKIELKEIFNSFDVSLITIDLINKNIVQLKNDMIIKNEPININVDEIANLVKKYVTYWDNEYINNKIMGGTSSELNLYTDDEIIKYSFKNKYPYNYDEFIISLKVTVNIL